MSPFRSIVRPLVLAALVLLLRVAPGYAQDAVVSEYYNTGDPSTEWTEVVVVKDNLNLVGWFVTDNNTEQNEAQGGIRFKDVPLWRNVRAGTIIVIWHRRGSSFASRDIDPSDGYLEIGRDDGTIVDVAQFGVSPGGPMNIAAGGDFLQILNADTIHVHGVGHRSPTGPYYDAAARPKANADGSVPNNGSVSVVGSSLAAYDAGITSDSVQITASTAAITQGLPNRFAGTAMTSRNHMLWRQWREPAWSVAAPTLRVVSQTAADQTVEWSAVTDPYPADRVTGVMLLRDTAGFATFDASVIRDGVSFTVGQNVSTARVVAVQSTEAGNRFTDASVECGKRYWYRAYAYRYAADQRLAVTPDSSARGRQWVTRIWAESPAIDRPLPAKPVIRANATAICPGDTLTLITSSVGTYYEWTVDGQPVAVTGTTRITITQPGRYALKVTAEGGCQAASDVFVVSALPAPVVDVTPSGVLTICSGDSVVLTATTPASAYEWRRNGSVIAGATASRYVARIAGDYQVRISSATGCPGASSVVSIRIPDTRFHFEPATLTFPTLGACDGSATATLTLVNDGTSALTPSGFAMPAGFSLLSPAPGSVVVPAGGRIMVTVLFAPTGVGPAGGTAVCTAQPCATTASFTVAGVRSEGLASINVSTVDYGQFLACSTEVLRGERLFTIRNDGTASLDVEVPDVQPPFYLMAFNPTTLAPGETVDVTVQYRPITPAERNRTDIQPIRFPFRAGSCRDTLRATLQATTITPRITIDEPVIDLGTVSPCDSVATTAYTFRNDGQQPLVLTAGSTTSLVVDGLPATVLPGTEVVLSARLPLSGTGAFEDSATVIVRPCDLPVVIRLLGVRPPSSASLSASSLVLPTVSLCVADPSSTASVVLQAGDATVDAVDVTGPFSVDLQAGDVVNGDRTITVTYRPTASGTATGTLVLVVGPCGRRVECALSGTAQTAGYTLTTSTLDFGQLLPGAVVQRSTTITNTGTEDLTIGVPAPVAVPFAFVGSSIGLPATLQPGGSIQVDWSYTYQGPDRTDATTVVWSIGSASCPVTETLALTGTTAPGETQRAQVRLSIPTTLRALAGERTVIPVHFDTDRDLPLATELRFRLNYDARVMIATSIIPINGSTVTSGTVVELSPGLAEVTVNAQGLVSRSPLFLVGATTFDGAPSTSLVITDVVLSDAEPTMQPGILTIDQDCAVNATGIGFGTTALTLRHAASVIDLDLQVASHDPTTLRLFDALGTLVATPLSASLTPGRYNVRFDAQGYATGTYFIVLEHGIRTVTVPVLLLR